jgi:hypothetical protein
MGTILWRVSQILASFQLLKSSKDCQSKKILFFLFLRNTTFFHRDASDSGGITALLGDYRARCLFSKVWTLREAAVIKTRDLLASEYLSNPGLGASLSPLAAIIKHGVNDKIAQVFAASIGLLDDLIADVTKSDFITSTILKLFSREKLPRATAAPLMDSILGHPPLPLALSSPLPCLSSKTDMSHR